MASTEAPVRDIETLIAAMNDAMRNGAGMKAPSAQSPLERLGARPLHLIDRSAAPPLLVGRISPNGHTILYGPGDAGKGLIASSWVTQVVRDGGRVLILDFEDHPEEWARRITSLGAAGLLDPDDPPIQHISPYLHALTQTADGRRVTTGINWPLIHEAASDHRASLIVIDSVAYAIPGMDPSDPQAATTYSAAIQPFGVPVLSLAHMNRMGDARYPFGSVFWHAGARITWSLVPDGQNGSKLHNRKHNNYEWFGAYMMTSDWHNDLPINVHERPYNVTVSERLVSILGDGPASLDDVVAAFADDEGGEPVQRETISRTLRRGLKATPKLWTLTDEKWSLVGSEEVE